MSTDTLWKIVSTVISLLVVPLFIFVWNTNTKMEHMQVEFNHTNKDVTKIIAELEAVEKDSQGVAVEVKLITQKLDRLESTVDEIHTILIDKQ
jgi:hypothetical protein